MKLINTLLAAKVLQNQIFIDDFISGSDVLEC